MILYVPQVQSAILACLDTQVQLSASAVQGRVSVAVECTWSIPLYSYQEVVDKAARQRSKVLTHATGLAMNISWPTQHKPSPVITPSVFHVEYTTT